MKLKLSSLNLRIIFISLALSPRSTANESEEHAFWMFGSYSSYTAVPTFMIIDFRFRTGEGEGVRSSLGPMDRSNIYKPRSSQH